MVRQPSTSLHIRLGTSRQLAAVLCGVHLGAVLCACANHLPEPVQFVLAASILLGGWRATALHAWRLSARSAVLLIWDRYGQWRLLQTDGRLLDVNLEHGAYSHPRLLILPFRGPSGRRRIVVISPDMVDAECLRNLRTRLRCEAQSGAGDAHDASVC